MAPMNAFLNLCTLCSFFLLDHRPTIIRTLYPSCYIVFAYFYLLTISWNRSSADQPPRVSLAIVCGQGHLLLQSVYSVAISVGLLTITHLISVCKTSHILFFFLRVFLSLSFAFCALCHVDLTVELLNYIPLLFSPTVSVSLLSLFVIHFIISYANQPSLAFCIYCQSTSPLVYAISIQLRRSSGRCQPLSDTCTACISI